MAAPESESTLAAKFASVLPHLDERQRRLMVAAEARALGRGGVTIAARASGPSRPTVSRGLGGLDAAQASPTRVRVPGGGRKPSVEHDRQLLADLDRLVEPTSRGDPQSPLRWTTKSTRTLAKALAGMGHQVSHTRVGQLLHQQRYSLQANAKTVEGAQHPDRDAQFGYINAQVSAFLRHGEPVLSVDTKKLSVDTKKKELVGCYRNPGRTWRPAGQPEPVNVYDFIDPVAGKAIPYGSYDLGRNHGWVQVGVDHDTAAFAVAALRAWWTGEGRAAYPKARRLLITADAGGANSYRTRLWKRELAALAEQTRLAITVCHFPPGTSKWNRVEHRLFAAISTNWRGQPLVSHEIIVNLIAAATNASGLSVHAELDRGAYPTGTEVTQAEIDALDITSHDFHGEWNYTIHPRRRRKSMKP